MVRLAHDARREEVVGSSVGCDVTVGSSVGCEVTVGRAVLVGAVVVVGAGVGLGKQALVPSSDQVPKGQARHSVEPVMVE